MSQRRLRESPSDPVHLRGVAACAPLALTPERPPCAVTALLQAQVGAGGGRSAVLPASQGVEPLAQRPEGWKCPDGLEETPGQCRAMLRS